MNTLSILMSAFVLSLVGLGFFIWSQRSRLLSHDGDGSAVIFATGEIGHAETTALQPASGTDADGIDSVLFDLDMSLQAMGMAIPIRLMVDDEDEAAARAIIAAAGDHRHAKRFRVWWPVRWLNWHFVN